MENTAIADRVCLLTDCACPVGDEAVCKDAASAGIDSLLVVKDDITPWPSEQGGLWCYVRPFANATTPTPCELQRITDFVSYERAHGRTVGIWVGDAELQEQVRSAATAEPPAPDSRPPSSDPCCCRPYHDGCTGGLVCHACPVEVVGQVLTSGQLLSKPRATGKSLEDIVQEMRDWGQPDPPDYFEYICLANGDCVAPDMLAIQRHAGRWLGPKECDAQFYPGVRFYFDPVALAAHPHVAWDGIQAIKIKDSLALDPYLVAAVAPEQDRNGSPLALDAPPAFRDRLVRLDHQAHFGLAAWSTAAFKVAQQCMG